MMGLKILLDIPSMKSLELYFYFKTVIGKFSNKELGVSLILNSLNKDYDQFVQNYKMYSMGKSIVELHAMLKLHEKGIPKKAKTPVALAIRECKIQKAKKKPKGQREQAKHELFKIVKAFHACKWEDRQSLSAYILKMKGYLDSFKCLGYAMPKELGVSLILNSLNKDYDQFVQNYKMHSMGKSIVELHAMLKLHEKGIPKKAKTPVALAIRECKIQKAKKKPKGQRVRTKERISLLMLPSLRSHRRLKEIIRQRTLSTTTARR
nr:zinc finger, CCHC-type [Tanacetum cinerariifolium]